MPPDRPRRSTRQAAQVVKSEPIEEAPVENPPAGTTSRSSASLSPAPSSAPSSSRSQSPYIEEGSTSKRSGRSKQQSQSTKASYTRTDRRKALDREYSHSAAGKAAREREKIKNFIRNALKDTQAKVKRLERSGATPELIAQAKAELGKAQAHSDEFEEQMAGRKKDVQSNREAAKDKRREARMLVVEEFLRRNGES